MFSLFPHLPIDIRRKIWLSTLGPMTLTFTAQGDAGKERPVDSDPDSPELPADGRQQLFRPPLLANYEFYFGSVALPDSSCRMLFVVESSAAYITCKESRAFLRFIFAEPRKPGGGLPSWFQFDIDTVRCKDIHLPIIAKHPWFTRTRHLAIVVVYEIYDYMGDLDPEESIMEGKNHNWIVHNLSSLENITFEMLYGHTYGPEGCGNHWLEEWFKIFEDWYNSTYADSPPPPFYARVVSHRDEIPEEEWLTPTNYLKVKKLVLQKHVKAYINDPESWALFGQSKEWMSVLGAEDRELEDPAQFLGRHRPTWN